MEIFRALQYPNFRLNTIGQSISLLGTWMQRIAISWMVYEMTDSMFWLGFVSFVSLAPSLLLSPFIGPVVDKHAKYKLVVITQVLLMIQTGALVLLVFLGMANVYWLCILGFVQGVINAFDVVGRQALLSFLVGSRKDLPNAIALNSSVFNAARMVGPAIGGFLLSSYGSLLCFVVNFLSFIPVLITLFMMNVKEEISTEVGDKISTWQGLLDGFDYLKRSPHIASLIVIMASSSLLVIPYTSLLPAVARDLFKGDEATFSWFESAAGFGALLGAVRMASLRSGENLRYRVMFSALIMGTSLLLLAYSHYLISALLFTIGVSFGMMMQNSGINTYIQTHSIPAYRARIMSYYVMALQGVFPVGSLLIGAVAEGIGVQHTLYLMGASGVLIAIAYYIYLRLHINRKLFG